MSTIASNALTQREDFFVPSKPSPKNMPIEQTAYIALGGNLSGTHGSPAETLRAALAVLATESQPQLRVTAVSSFYASAPQGFVHQDDFVNAVAQLQTRLSADNLLAYLHKIEQRFGRRRLFRNGPRTLDLDLLLYGNEVRCARHERELCLPHPRMHLRAFVLYPLAEIAPQLLLPGRGSLAAWLPAVANQGVVRLQDAQKRSADECAVLLPTPVLLP